MKIIFLDIDGVLNGDLFVPTDDKPGVLIDGTRLELVRHIVDETGAEIVSSSSWKGHWGRTDSECDDTGKKSTRSSQQKDYQSLIKHRNIITTGSRKL